MSMEEEIKKLKTEVGTIKSLLQKVLNPEGKIDLNLTVEEMLVNIQNKGKVTYNIDTTNNDGRIMLCALKDLEGKPFTWTDMDKALRERGWGIAGHGTLSVALSKLVSPKSLLIAEGATKDRTYRLPSKITFTGDELI